MWDAVVAAHGDARRSSPVIRGSDGRTRASTSRSNARARPARGRRRPRRPRRHLVAEQRRVGRRPVRDREGRRDPRQHQPGLPAARARVRAPAVGLLACSSSRRLQGRRLRRARRRRRRAGAPRERVVLGERLGGAARPATTSRVDHLRAREAELEFDEPINIQYTSGTTGFPKGATLSHHNILNNGYFIGETLGYTPADRICVPVPFYHCFGMVMGNLAASPTAPASSIPARRSSRGRRSGDRGGAVHVALRRADDVHRRAGPRRRSPTSTCHRCAPGSWPARRARSR